MPMRTCVNSSRLSTDDCRLIDVDDHLSNPGQSMRWRRRMSRSWPGSTDARRASSWAVAIAARTCCGHLFELRDRRPARRVRRVERRAAVPQPEPLPVVARRDAHGAVRLDAVPVGVELRRLARDRLDDLAVPLACLPRARCRWTIARRMRARAAGSAAPLRRAAGLAATPPPAARAHDRRRRRSRAIRRRLRLSSC